MTALAAAIPFLASLLAAAAVAGCLYLLLAIAAVRRLPHDRREDALGKAAVTVLKPLHGDADGLRERLLSFCDQDYGGAIQLVLGCQDQSDPALAVARRVAALRPDRAIEIVIDPRLAGSNRKVSNLIHCLAQARHDVIVLADDDIAVERGYLARVTGALACPGIGAVTCLYVGGGVGLHAGLSALAIDGHFLPNVLVGMRLGAAEPCFGSTIAIRRDTLRRIGGLEAFADRLADDYAIGAAVRALGLSIAVPGFAVRHDCGERSLAAVLSHQLRVARTIRGINPAGHLGALITHPLPLALTSACLAPPRLAPAAAALAVAALVLRAVLIRDVARRFGSAPRRDWLLPVCDLLLFAVHLASFFGSEVIWRGHRYLSRADGSFVPQERAG